MLTEKSTGLTSTATITMKSTVNVSIGLAKRVSEVKTETNGSLTITYTFTVKNHGNVPLVNVQVSDNLRLAFPAPMDIVARGVVASGSLRGNVSYTGIGDNNLLLAGSTLAVGASETFTMTVNVLPNGSYGTFLNSATATATGSQVGGTTTDVSMNGSNTDPNGNNIPGDPGEDAKTSVIFTREEVRIPEGFSPNGDGINDYLVIENLGKGKIDLEVYNRWGNIVYKDKDYKNTWNGICNTGIYVGKEIPDGTYYYIYKIDGVPGAIKFLTINR
ncbi:MAG: T9SS type B sorting domain-containing protein [Sphingobacteriales bacterium]|nr:MAG: T9SS type B sorting domain-containing protein [Sphingobacteriales bacterium]